MAISKSTVTPIRPPAAVSPPEAVIAARGEAALAKLTRARSSAVLISGSAENSGIKAGDAALSDQFYALHVAADDLAELLRELSDDVDPANLLRVQGGAA